MQDDAEDLDACGQTRGKICPQDGAGEHGRCHHHRVQRHVSGHASPRAQIEQVVARAQIEPAPGQAAKQLHAEHPPEIDGD